jgi:hypothetical protein
LRLSNRYQVDVLVFETSNEIILAVKTMN